MPKLLEQILDIRSWGIHRLFSILDSEGVALFQVIVYFHTAAAGAYCAFIAGGAPATVADALGPGYNTAWLWLCMGTTICLAGKLLSSRPDKRKFWVHTTGLHLQLAGDFFALGAFASYVFSTLQEQTWGKAIIAAWVFAALAECAFFLCWRDIRRIRQAEKAVRQ